MAVKWTNEQKEAIEAKDCSLIVSAAAGSGKTAVLVERIIQKLEHSDIDRFLVVTFTKAAAAQMRQKIVEAIEKSLLDPLITKKRSKQLQRQLSLISGAKIMTIHSFCNEVVKNNFDKLAIEPDFKIGEETVCKMLLQEAADELFSEKYDEGRSDFLDFIEAYSRDRDDKAAMELVLQLHSFLKTLPYPQAFADTALNMYNPSENPPFLAEVLEECKVEIEKILIFQKTAFEMMDEYVNMGAIRSIFEEDLAFFNSLNACCKEGYDSAHTAYTAHSFSAFRKPKGEFDLDLFEQLKDLRNAVKKQTEALSAFLGRSASQINALLQRQYPYIKSLIDLAFSLDEIFAAKKRERQIVDFNDLEHYTISLLSKKATEPSEIALALSEEIDEIIVDEYQDTNAVQEEIFSLVSKNQENIFMVGDIKQSIYRFRHTAPELFLHKTKHFSDIKTAKKRRVFLKKNFRSRKEIIDSVNFIFGQIMSHYVGEISYDENQTLYCGAQYPEKECSTKLTLIETNNEWVDAQEPIFSVRAEAIEIARGIQSYVKSQYPVYDRENDRIRGADYKDFAILLRATKDRAKVIEEELINAGIPVYSDVGAGLTERLEVKTVLSILSIIDNPRQDIPLVFVLRSPLFGFDENLLAKIRLGRKEGGFYEALVQFGEKDQKVFGFLKDLDSWRRLSVYSPVSILLEKIYAKTGYFSFVGVLPDGAQRQANLKFLSLKAREYEKGVFKGLFSFIRYIRKSFGGGSDLSSPKLIPENANVVRIMSIHKSKGLEFPIVFLPCLSKNFNMTDQRQRLLIHPQMGIGLDFVDPNLRIKIASPLKNAIKHRLKKETLSEEMRILYVALTRAKEQLILSGAVEQKEKTLKRFQDALKMKERVLPAAITGSAKSYLDWIGLSLIRHCQTQSLRPEIAGAQEYLIEDESKFEISFIVPGENPCTAEQREEREPVLTDVGDEVKRRLEYTYAHKKNLFAKIAVSELKRLFNEQDEDAKELITPELLLLPMDGAVKKTALKKGTLTHFVMERLDPKKTKTREGIANFARQIEADGAFLGEDISKINCEQIYEFLHTDIGRRFTQADTRYKETPFNIRIDAGIINPSWRGEKIQMQGIIDCFFFEKDNLVLLDYKTDRAKGEEYFTKKYKIQMDCYEMALRTMFHSTKVERYIYSFHLGKQIRV